MQTTEIFGLTAPQNTLLFSLQHLIVEEDINNEKDSEKKTLKRRWLFSWEEEMNTFLREGANDDSAKIITNTYDLNVLLESVQKDLKNLKTPLYLILLECVLFVPYYKLEKISDDLNKKYSKLKINDTVQKNTLTKIAKMLNISENYIEIFQSSYKDAQRNLTGFWKKVLLGGLIGTALIALTAGFAAPFIASAFAAGGLSGAAAMSAGLAALGGGAVAAGGFGIAGGIAVVVGGGAILGAVTGSTAGALMAASPDFTLSQSAKLEVVMKEIILGAQKDVRLAQEIINQQRQTIQNAEKELDNLKLKANADKKRIDNLEKSIMYLKKALEQNIELVKAA
jgi:hypothetical protein